MSDENKTATTERKKRNTREIVPPSFSTNDELMNIVQAQRAAGGAVNRSFTAGGFNSVAGIDNLPPHTRGAMAASLVLSLANSAAGEGDEANSANAVLSTLTPFLGNASNIAAETRKLAAYEQIAALEGIAARKDNESAADFIGRVKKATKG